MKQNEFMVALIDKKEKLHEFYANQERILSPLFKGILTFVVLMLTKEMFPYDSVVNHIPIIVAISVIQGFLPLFTLYFFSTAMILANLWEAGFDIFLGFLAFVLICLISYVRVNYRYMYIAAIIPLLFWAKIGMAIPAVLAMAIGLEALVPCVIGLLVYYFSCALEAAFASMSPDQPKTLGIALKAVAVNLGKEQTMFVFLLAVILTILLTTILRKLFYERAWLVAAILGNVFMAFILMMGSLYLDLNVTVPRIFFQMGLGLILCICFEFFRGIGDVSRMEKTVFEDEEYIYYVKAVPKMRLAQKDLNVKVVNESYEEEEFGEEDFIEEEEFTKEEEFELSDDSEETEVSDNLEESEISRENDENEEDDEAKEGIEEQ